MKQPFWWSLACVMLIAQGAAAQRRTLQGFENNCAGQPIAVDQLTGSVTQSSDAYAACGIASIETGESPGQMKIGRNVVLFPIAGVTGDNAVAGAFSLFSPSTLTIVFAPAVNELSFEVLNLNTPSRLRITSYDAAGSPLSDEAAPPASGGKVTWSRNASTAVTRVVLSYPQMSGLFTSVNRWFVDQLSFNAWKCGDGEIDNLNGGSEVCDDGNTAQCDGCSTTCTASIVGCLDGSTCVAPSAGSGCMICDPTKPPSPAGDVLLSPRPTGVACDDALKCTLGDACDGAGHCTGSARSCDDAITCTSDTCSEAALGDGCTHTLGAHDCLIGTTCVAELAVNPSNVCQLCAPARASNAWSAQANTVRCAPPSCIGDQFAAAALCDGAGSCPVVTPMSCGNFACATATSCTDACSNDRECAATSHCDTVTMKCVNNFAAGTACTASAQCADGLACADGVCCDSACGSKCETCNAPGFTGKCINITFGDPEHECPDGSSCRSGNQCVADPLPVTPPMMPEPLPPTPPVAQDAGMSSLPPPVLPIGAACDRNELCGLGVCRDGVCCSSACDGPCEGCNVLGAAPGQCTAYSLGSDPEDECGGTGGVCSGERACTSFQTRGNGLCSATPATRGGSQYALGMLTAVAALLAWRRRR